MASTSSLSSTRTQGDGMENIAITKADNKDKRVLGDKLIYRPRDFNQVSLPPPILPGRMVNLVPRDAIQYNKKNAPVGTMISKEPRFVPYEPYKAAVKPMIPNEKLKKEKVSIKPIVTNQGNINIDSKETETQVLQDEVKKLKEDLFQMEAQMKFHAQVNCDLKTLLVAAVGEDLEMRVQLLTEDKLQLARALLSSAQVCTNHQERTEHLAGQCEVWRSKFLASSLMLEDLARRKASLTRHAADLENVTRSLLEDRSSLWDSQVNTFKSLTALRDGFAPGESSVISSPVTTVGLSHINQRLSSELRHQLLGGRLTLPSTLQLDQDTSLEQTAKKLLGGVAGLSTQDAACNAVMGAASSIATRQPVCCSHCTGEVHTV